LPGEVHSVSVVQLVAHAFAPQMYGLHDVVFWRQSPLPSH
jgi:hypothetical protein